MAYSARPSPAELRVFPRRILPGFLPGFVPFLPAWLPGSMYSTDRERLAPCSCPGGLARSGGQSLCLLFAPFTPVPAAWDSLRQIQPEAFLISVIYIITNTNTIPGTQSARTPRDQDKARGPRKPSGWSARPSDGSRCRLRLVAQGTPGLGHHSGVSAWDASVGARHAIPIGICGPAGTSSSGDAIAPLRLALPAARPIYSTCATWRRNGF